MIMFVFLSSLLGWFIKKCVGVDKGSARFVALFFKIYICTSVSIYLPTYIRLYLSIYLPILHYQYYNTTMTVRVSQRWVVWLGLVWCDRFCFDRVCSSGGYSSSGDSS